MSDRTWTIPDFDQCACGDYRKDHRGGSGPCAFNSVGGNVHGQRDCMHFRLSRAATEIPAPYSAPPNLEARNAG